MGLLNDLASKFKKDKEESAAKEAENKEALEAAKVVWDGFSEAEKAAILAVSGAETKGEPKATNTDTTTVETPAGGEPKVEPDPEPKTPPVDSTTTVKPPVTEVKGNPGYSQEKLEKGQLTPAEIMEAVKSGQAREAMKAAY